MAQQRPRRGTADAAPNTDYQNRPLRWHHCFHALIREASSTCWHRASVDGFEGCIGLTRKIGQLLGLSRTTPIASH
jgi:hypothetical protein